MWARGPKIWIALALCAACKKSEPQKAKPVPAEEAPRELTDQEIADAACAGKPKCAVDRVWRTKRGVAVAQALVDTSKGDAEPPLTEDTCAPYEHWLVKKRGKDVERTLLLETCNDGYGASGVGEDSFEVKDGVFTHVQSGGSASRWEHTSVLELEPLRLRAIGWWNGWSIASAFERGTFDFVDFKGHVRWFKPPCPPGGGPPDDGIGAGSDDTTDSPDLFVFDPIPSIQTPAGFDWKTTELAACAPPFDGITQGYVVHGPKADPADGSMRVLALERTVLIEVTDDISITNSPKWLHDDHLELWLEDEPTDPADLCIPTAAGSGAGWLRQWAIRLADGKLFPGYGAPSPAKDPLKVEHHANRLRIDLPKSVANVTVVFSDGDDGKSQERLIATSRLAFGKAPTLGRLWDVPPSEVVCTVRDGKLVRELKRDFSRHTPEQAALHDVP